MTIRKAHLSDLPYLYEICHLTGHNGQDATPFVSDRLLLGHFYAAPYLVRSTHWCWVAVDDGVPVGYLVTTPDSEGFADWMEESWLPALRQLYPTVSGESSSDFERWLRGKCHEPKVVPGFVADYPAHLHIDFLPRAQGQGLGKKLIAAFVDQCSQEGIPGIHLGVGSENTKARGFYEKLGFRVIQEAPGVAFLGLKPGNSSTKTPSSTPGNDARQTPSKKTAL